MIATPLKTATPAPERLARLVEARYGLATDAPSPALASALERFAARHSLSAQSALEQATSNPALLRELAGHLGVPETYFFRHPELFDELVPFVERALHQRAQLTVWSVGCCRGEEVYSLAFALAARLGPGWSSRVSLRGCDISLEALATARAGVYGRWSFRGPPSEALREASFEPLDGERWRVPAELRAAVAFEHLSAQELAGQLEPGSVDVVLFRNVAVYFAAGAVQPLYQAFAAALRPGGLLCLATTDPAPQVPGLVSAQVALGLYEKRVDLPLAPRRAARPRSAPLAPRPAPLAPRPSAPPPVRDARQLADAGQVDEALELLEKPGQAGLPDSARHLLRGQICLGAGRLPEATGEFRRVLYLEPGHLLGRYWAALTFARAGATGQALQHALELERLLQGRDGTAAVEDGLTVGELRRALTELKERLT